MKVYLGPYKDVIKCEWHTKYMNKKYGFFEWDENTKFESVLEKLEDAVQWVYDVTINKVRSTERKESVVIHGYDVWSMDCTLASIIYPMLLELKRVKHGSVLVDDKDVPEDLRNKHLETSNGEVKGGHQDEHDRLLHAKWAWVLDEMIFAFENKVKGNWEEQFCTGNIEMYHLPLDKDQNPVGEAIPFSEEYSPEVKAKMKFSQLVKGPNDTYTCDYEARKAYQARISNGFRLMGTYFEGLWD